MDAVAIREVRVTLGGQERLLICDLGVWAAVEDHGYKLLPMLADLNAGNLSFKGLLVLLWAMLRGGSNGGPPVTMEQVGHWVTGENFAAVQQSMGLALRMAFPAGDSADPPPTAGDGTGTPPNPSPVAAESLSTSSGG